MYSVNFASEINEIISEVKYLEQLGFTVPELARNMALQEKKYGQFRDGLTNMLTRYERIMGSLNDAELDLLQERIWTAIFHFRWLKIAYDIPISIVLDFQPSKMKVLQHKQDPDNRNK